MVQDNYKAEIIIEKEVKDVFGFVSDLNNLPLWAGASEVKTISGESNNVGSIYEVTFPTFLFKLSVPVEIVKYNFPDIFSFRDNSKQITFNYVFENAENDTKVSLACDLNDVPFSFSQQKMNKLLTDLKKFLEAEIAPSGEIAD